MSVSLREWKFMDTVDEIGDLVWDGLPEGWAEHKYGEGNSPAL